MGEWHGATCCSKINTGQNVITLFSNNSHTYLNNKSHTSFTQKQQGGHHSPTPYTHYRHSVQISPSLSCAPDPSPLRIRSFRFSPYPFFPRNSELPVLTPPARPHRDSELLVLTDAGVPPRPPPPPCVRSGRKACRAGGCYPVSGRCDGRPDCGDMSDESGCELLEAWSV